MDVGEQGARSLPIAQPAAETAPDPFAGQGLLVSTWIGRLALSALMLLFVFYLVAWNLPKSDVRSDLRDPIDRGVFYAGIGQNWGVFAPNPVSRSYRVEADVEFPDGTVERFEFYDGEPVLASYREFRWRKYETRIRQDNNSHLLRPTAQWIHDQYGDREPRRVTILEISHKVPEPGSGADPDWETEELFTLTFSGAGT